MPESAKRSGILFAARLAVVFCLFTLILAQIIFAYYIGRETYIAGPVQDVWGIMPYIEKNLYGGSWFTRDLWTAQNSHRLPLLKLGFLTDYYYFQGSNLFLILLITSSVFIQIGFVFVALKPKAFFSDEMMVFLCSASVLISPTLNWGFLHPFNIHFIHAALFAMISCVLFDIGLRKNKNSIFLCGIFFAFLCNISAFTITAIWPALLFLLFVNKSTKLQKFTTIISAILSFVLFFCILPSGKGYEGSLSEEGMIILISFESAKNLLEIKTFIFLVNYLVSYLSMYPSDLFFNKTLSAFSLLYFICAIIKNKSFRGNPVAITGLSFMLFGVFMAMATAIGRGYLGELSLGIRFQPVVLVYWCGFFLSCLSAISSVDKNRIIFLIISGLISIYLIFIHYLNGAENQKQMLGDYMRFSRMQMAYVSNNFEPNAIYENMVDEWRKKSYPGILASIPFLRENSLGIFNQPVGKFAMQNPSPPARVGQICLVGKIYEKPRNNDISVRNVTFKASQISSTGISHLLIYENSRLNGMLFRKPLDIFKSGSDGIWIGITKTPVDFYNISVIAFRQDDIPCSVSVLN